MILSDTFVSLVRHYREYAANCLAKRSAMGMGNVGFGAGSASSEPVLALFPRLAADPALMMVRQAVSKTIVDSRRRSKGFRRWLLKRDTTDIACVVVLAVKAGLKHAASFFSGNIPESFLLLTWRWCLFKQY